jgi:hypothetical protein
MKQILTMEFSAAVGNEQRAKVFSSGNEGGA